MGRNDALTRFQPNHTPQTVQADPRQVLNHQGGYVFKTSKVQAARRFLILGTDGGTFYATEREHTRENAAMLIDLARTDPALLLGQTLAVSMGGLAPRQNPGLFAMAVLAAYAPHEHRRDMLKYLPQVARTGTSLFQFATYAAGLRGWGKTLRRAIADWYIGQPADALAYQMVKYRQRDGWSHRDLLRLSHPVTNDDAHRALFEWAARGTMHDDLPDIVKAWSIAQSATKPGQIVDLIRDHGLSWEMLPSQWHNDPAVWTALLDFMPIGALIRQLPRLTRLGLAEPLTPTLTRIVAALTDARKLEKGRIHPMTALLALRTYAAGEGRNGRDWTPAPEIVDALDAAFYQTFGNVTPSGARTLIGLDVSGSMSASVITGTDSKGQPVRPPLSAREAAMAMTLLTIATEPKTHLVAFSAGPGAFESASESRLWRQRSTVTPLTITPRTRLLDAVRAVEHMPFSGTDCSLPMQYAQARGLQVDTFVVYTDNETAHGQVHPHEALAEYRRQTGIDAKLVVAAMSATDFTIADPTDPGMLDIVGLDASAPQLIRDFSAGEV